jgi:hypothetical protein
MRRFLLALMAALAGLGVAASPASAHSVSGVSATNLQTNLTSVEPERPGLSVKIVEAGSRIEVENRTGTELIVFGYKDPPDPYLRIGPDGVFQNRLSPATYINASREGENPPDIAKNANSADTDWEKISSEPLARWHDHRIHWMAPGDPPQVRSDPGARHVVFPEWIVPMRLGTDPVSVKGELVWEPGPSALLWYVLIVVLIGVVVLVGRRPDWATGLAVVTAVLVAVDVFHALGLGLANAGDLGERIVKSVTQAPLALLDWAAGALAIVWLRRRRPDGLSVAVLAGLLVALLGGLSDVDALSRSEVPFGFGAGLARLTVAVSIGLGFGLAVSAGLRLAGVWGPSRRPVPARDEPTAAAATTP